MLDNIFFEINKIGIKQISKIALKDWFADRPYIHCTIAEVVKAADSAGITIKDCKTEIPSWFMPVSLSKMEAMKLGPIFRKEELFDLYVTKNLSPLAISKLKKCNMMTVFDNLNKFDIELKRIDIKTKQICEKNRQKSKSDL